MRLHRILTAGLSSRGLNFGRSGKFETREPSNQNAVDIFQGKWATDLSVLGVDSGGPVDHLTSDPRPVMAARLLGKQDRFDGYRVLELGPLEGAHTFQLERLGAAEVVAIEANKEAFLKCLIVRNLAKLQRANFLLGDFVSHLESVPKAYDLIFCCGVLYHLENPVHLIRLISKATTRCFVWTHYYQAQRCPGRTAKPVTVHGFKTNYFVSKNKGREGGRFWGGPRPTAAWLEKEAILEAFRHFGFSKVSPVGDEENNPNGPAITFAAEA